MPTNSTEVLAGRVAGLVSKVQGDLFGVDPSERLAVKAKLARSTKWLRDLRQANADVAAELITLNVIAAKDCFQRQDYEGLARHSSLVLQYTLPRLNAVVVPGSVNGEGGAVMMQWAPAAPDADPNTVEG